MHWLYLPLFIATCWLLHVSAVVCHHQGAYWIHLSYLKNTNWGLVYHITCGYVAQRDTQHTEPRQSGTQAT
jgi:hypothetical protein